MKLNPVFNENNQIITYNDIERFVNKMRTEWEVLLSSRISLSRIE